MNGTVVLVAITALWGMTFVVVKDALVLASPAAFLSARFSVAALAALGFWWRFRSPPGRIWRHGLIAGAFLALGYFCQTRGLALVSPARSAFLTGLYVVFVPLAGRVVFGRWPRADQWLGVGLALLGLFVLTRPDMSGGFAVGDLWTIGCAFTFGCHMVLTQRFSAGGTGFVAVQMVVVALACGLALPSETVVFQSTPALWAAVILCGVGANAVAINLQTWAQARVPAVRTAVVFALEPVFAALTSTALGRERFSLSDLLGGGLIVGGVIVSEIRS